MSLQDHRLATTIRSTAAVNLIHSPKQTAEILGVSVRTLKRMVERGEAPRRTRVSVGRVGFSTQAIEEFLTANTETAA